MKSKKLKKSLLRNYIGLVDCNQQYCYADNTIPNLPNLPKSADFRELGLTGKAKHQGGCGSCWAFAISAALETCLLNNN
jgi:C1A family cysteine protease